MGCMRFLDLRKWTPDVARLGNLADRLVIIVLTGCREWCVLVVIGGFVD